MITGRGSARYYNTWYKDFIDKTDIQMLSSLEAKIKVKMQQLLAPEPGALTEEIGNHFLFSIFLLRIKLFESESNDYEPIHNLQMTFHN